MCDCLCEVTLMAVHHHLLQPECVANSLPLHTVYLGLNARQTLTECFGANFLPKWFARDDK